MIKIVALVLTWGILLTSQAVGKPRYTYAPIQDRHALGVYEPSQTGNPSRYISRSAKKTKTFHLKSKSVKQGNSKPVTRVFPVIVAHPAGCPRSRFCGCGVSLRVYGKRVRSLYLAANWLKFPRAEAAPGMVAARRGHVYYIIRVIGNGRVLAYDPNSGKRQTRIHIRSLAGFTVVNPKREKTA